MTTNATKLVFWFATATLASCRYGYERIQQSSIDAGAVPPTGGTSPNGGTSSTGVVPPTGGTSSAGNGATTGGTANGTGTAGTSNSGGTTGTAGTTGNAWREFDPASKSCQGSTTLCQGQSCCTSIALPKGTFKMGRSTEPTATDYYDGSDSEIPEHNATVAAFALDRYEVTVARVRQFVAVYDQWHKTDHNPSSGSGANPNASNTGWDVAWNTADSSDLPADVATMTSNLNCGNGNYTRQPGKNDTYPINCLNWYEAFAFCIWDGGRLPTEAEWEYVAAGGALNQLYPWGNGIPDASRANYQLTTNAPGVAVGSMGPTGAGYFGHQDLAGSMWEWVLDWYLDVYYGTPANPSVCVDCANTAAGTYRVSRGSAWDYTDYYLRSAARGYFMPGSRGGGMGLRCARAAP